ncbi:MAG TPA: amidohydrolase family protein [Thermoanaerobaculia bacterium]|jgi:predicted amidohydrolase YtcJ|nr:amidohydrolase family protein [Thermoanaerobaculia bacterium]
MRAFVRALGAMAVAGCVSRTLVLPPSAHLRAGSEPADLVVLDARVFTSEQASPWAEAVAARDGRLVYVGTSRGAAVHVGPDTRVIDAGGRLLTPGFVDNHCHFLWLGYLTPLLVDLYDQELPQMRAAIRAFADQHPDHPFLLGVGWTPAAIGEDPPSKELLDTIEAQRPVFLWSNGGQEGWVNSAAVELMRERKPEVFARLGPLPNPAEPDATFDQFHAFNPFDFFRRDELPAGLEEQLLRSVEKQLASALSYGVTAFDDAQVHDTSCRLSSSCSAAVPSPTSAPAAASTSAHTGWTTPKSSASCSSSGGTSAASMPTAISGWATR